MHVYCTPLQLCGFNDVVQYSAECVCGMCDGIPEECVCGMCAESVGHAVYVSTVCVSGV